MWRPLISGALEALPVILVLLGLWAYYGWRDTQCSGRACSGGETPVRVQGGCVCLREAK